MSTKHKSLCKLYALAVKLRLSNSAVAESNSAVAEDEDVDADDDPFARFKI